VARVEIEGTADFKALSRALREAGKGQIAREMAKGLREGAQPLVKQAQDNVRSLRVSGVRGGASARAARTLKALGKKKRPSERVKQKAHQGSGLRATVARATNVKLSTSARAASMRLRAQQAKMPADQRRLPAYLNKGKWRHPLFGNKERWYEQKAPPAWFDDAAEKRGPQTRDKAVEVVAKYLEHIV
jgi:hypothetical protein